MNKSNRNKLLLMLAVIILVMLACSELAVTNKTDVPIRITVSMPGGVGPESTLLGASEETSFSSDGNGTYTLTAIADEEYRSRLMVIRDDMTMILIEGFQVIGEGTVSTIINKVSNINKLLENLESVSCSGHVDDDNPATAYVTVDMNAGKLVVNCD